MIVTSSVSTSDGNSRSSRMYSLEHVLEIRNVIGEGPVWHSGEEALYWVNFIEQHQILRFTPADGQHEVFETGTPVMALGIRERGGMIAATGRGLASWNPASNIFEQICDPLANRPGIRFNDAAVDGRGRFWVGTMNQNDAKAPDGELLRLESDGRLRQMDSGITVSNGIGWSPDKKTMYFVDSFRYCIYSYDFDLESGSIQNRRVFVQNSSEQGIPDGMTVDSEGCVWTAYWGGWSVVRYKTDGSVDAEYRLPVPNPTSCCFGGKNLDELYITSAHLGMSAEEKKQSPQSGDLFRLRTGISGMDEPRVRLI
jgi:sugar lactone lactonase YvrE